MKEDIFDNIIKQKVSNFTVTQNGKDVWSEFTSANPDFHVLDILEEPSFDHIIKQKLESLSTNGIDKDVWSEFESSNPEFADVNDSENNTFDHIIKNSLQHIRPSYRSDHWRLMKIRLNIIEERQNTVIMSKLMEFAAIFLIIFTFYHWSLWIDVISSEPSPVDHLQYAAVKHPNLKFQQNNGNKKQIQKNNTNNIVDKSTKHYKSKVVGLEHHLSIEGNVSNQPLIDNNKFDALPYESNFISELTSSGILANAQDKEQKYISVNNAIDDILNPISVINPSSDVSKIPVIENEELQSEFAKSFPMKISPSQPKTKYMLSAFASTDVNLINTPFDKLYSKASYNKEALNNSYGINISKKINRFELETGIGYAKRQYQPAIVREAFGQKENYYSEVSLNKISFDIATIPVNFKYDFIHQTNWNVYLMAGAALNLVMNADYEIDQTKIEGRPAPERYTPEVARLEKKPFIDGILAGENVQENYFASIGFGFGIEKKIFNNTSIYIQPSYHRQILSADIGIGPNKDKIHTTSLQFGIKTALN